MPRIFTAINPPALAGVIAIALRVGNLGRTVSRRARYPAVAMVTWHAAVKERQGGGTFDPGPH